MPINEADINDLISVIIPTFNREVFIEETLNSLLTQTHTNWEAIIVDDLSTDSTKEKVSQYQSKDERIKFSERDSALKGGSVCRNIGITKAKGNYVVFLDSDDVLASWCLEQRIKVMKEFPALDFGIFNTETFTTKPGDGKLHTVFLSSNNFLYHFIAGHNIWQTSSPIWKKSFIIKLGGFNEAYQRFQDTEFHFRALKANDASYKAFYKLKPDCYYRLIYHKRPIFFWDVVIENNILYLNEVTSTNNQQFNADLYKISISVLSIFAVMYSLKAHKQKAGFLFAALSKPAVKQYLSQKIFIIFRIIFYLNNARLFSIKPIQNIMSKTLSYMASNRIKKIA